MKHLILVVGITVGLVGWGLRLPSTAWAQNCYSEQQVTNSCALYAKCFYLLNGQVYDYGSCSSPHQGHVCGSKFASIPSLHNSMLNTIFPGLRRGKAYAPPPLVATSDLNGDGKVNLFDQVRVIRSYGTKGECGFGAADIIQDGGVDYVDLGKLLTNYK